MAATSGEGLIRSIFERHGVGRGLSVSAGAKEPFCSMAQEYAENEAAGRLVLSGWSSLGIHGPPCQH